MRSRTRRTANQAIRIALATDTAAIAEAIRLFEAWSGERACSGRRRSLAAAIGFGRTANEAASSTPRRNARRAYLRPMALWSGCPIGRDVILHPSHWKEPEMTDQKPLAYIATAETRNFSFAGHGSTEVLARAALESALATHGRQYELPRGWWLEEAVLSEVRVIPIIELQSLRDNEPLPE